MGRSSKSNRITLTTSPHLFGENFIHSFILGCFLTRTHCTLSSFKSTFNSIASVTFNRLSKRFDIGVRFRLRLGGGVSSVIVDAAIGSLDCVSFAGPVVSRRLSRSSDIGVSLLASCGGGGSCSHRAAWLLLALSPNQTSPRSSFGIFSLEVNCVADVCFLFT